VWWISPDRSCTPCRPRAPHSHLPGVQDQLGAHAGGGSQPRIRQENASITNAAQTVGPVQVGAALFDRKATGRWLPPTVSGQAA